MKVLLLSSLFTLGIMSAHAQEAGSNSIALAATEAAPAPAVSFTVVTVPEKALAQLEKIRKQTQNAVVIGRRGSDLPAETRPMLNKVLLQSATDFLNITSKQPNKEAYFQSVDKGLARLSELISKQEDRVEIAEYYQDLLDIVGLESSEGRLVAFVEGSGAAKP